MYYVSSVHGDVMIKATTFEAFLYAFFSSKKKQTTKLTNKYTTFSKAYKLLQLASTMTAEPIIS